MTFRVWPLWVRLLRAVLLLVLILALGIGVGSLVGVDLLPDLPVPDFGP